MMAAQQQEQEIGDGTNFVLIFAGELLANAGVLISKGLHPSEIIVGYTKAGEKAVQILEGIILFI